MAKRSENSLDLMTMMKKETKRKKQENESIFPSKWYLKLLLIVLSMGVGFVFYSAAAGYYAENDIRLKIFSVLLSGLFAAGCSVIMHCVVHEMDAAGKRKYKAKLLEGIVRAEAAREELKSALQRNLKEEDDKQFEQAICDCDELERMELQRARQLFAMYLQNPDKAEELLIQEESLI